MWKEAACEEDDPHDGLLRTLPPQTGLEMPSDSVSAPAGGCAALCERFGEDYGCGFERPVSLRHTSSGDIRRSSWPKSCAAIATKRGIRGY